MAKKVAAVFGGVLLGIALAFARAGAFPFWSSTQTDPAKPDAPVLASPVASAKPETAVAAPAAQSAPAPVIKGAVPLPSFAPLVKRVMPTVVNVSVVQEVKANAMPFQFGGPGGPGGGPNGPGGGEQGGPGQSPFGGGPMGPGDPFEQFRHFFGEVPHQFKQHGLGSGVIVSPDGYILTNNHVVGEASEIHVTLSDQREFKARVIGKDSKTDLALIKIDTKVPLTYATLGDSDKTEVGDWVIAIGNPFGFSLTVTSGIVSAKGRALGGNYDNFIQTDASINPGNSGGPLFDTNGAVIGINTAIYSSTGTNAGIGFAIPVDLAKGIMDQLKSRGRVIRGWLGVEIQQVTPDLAQQFGLAKPEGALVANVVEDGPAAKAGIKRGDIIMTFDGRPVPDEHHLPEMVAQTQIDKTVPLEILRDGKNMKLEVKVGELKETKLASAKSEEGNNNWGLQVQELTPEIAQQLNLKSDKGVVVRGVTPDTPGADAGVQPGDVLLEVNHKKVSSVQDFLSQAKAAKDGKKPALLLVQRGDATLYTVIKPES
ncbi:MAG: DegQ family serine endoprotease [Candidatus Binataceae bacterium]|nr:DegQ family serine endoprotease [Candidatus Binataceae bacterium]